MTIHRLHREPITPDDFRSIIAHPAIEGAALRSTQKLCKLHDSPRPGIPEVDIGEGPAPQGFVRLRQASKRGGLVVGTHAGFPEWLRSEAELPFQASLALAGVFTLAYGMIHKGAMRTRLTVPTFDRTQDAAVWQSQYLGVKSMVPFRAAAAIALDAVNLGSLQVDEVQPPHIASLANPLSAKECVQLGPVLQ